MGRIALSEIIAISEIGDFGYHFSSGLSIRRKKFLADLDVLKSGFLKISACGIDLDDM
jgi:hypothetical protein